MIALLTGVISESMFEKNQLRVDEERLERESKRKMLSEQFGELFDELIEEHLETGGPLDGVSEEEIDSIIPDVCEFLEENGIQFSRADLLVVSRVMDVDDSGSICKDEFAHGLLSIVDGVRPMSIMELFHGVSLLKSNLAQCYDKVQDIHKHTVSSIDASEKLQGNNSERQVAQ